VILMPSSVATMVGSRPILMGWFVGSAVSRIDETLFIFFLCGGVLEPQR
jgi:hypothetical protein